MNDVLISDALGTPEDELARLREAVDAADVRLFEALLDRAEAVRCIGMLKSGGGSVFRPAREAAVLRALLGRARGTLPPELIVHVWRGLFGAFCRMQGGLRAAYVGSGDDAVRRDVIRNGFGTFIELMRLSGANAVLNEAAAHADVVGVLPVPVDGEPRPWWPSLAHNDRGVRIVAVLPCVGGISPAFDSVPQMLAAQVPFEASGEDFTLLTLASAQVHSRSGLQTAVAERLHRNVRTMAVVDEAAGQRLHLLQIDGYPDDDLTQCLQDLGVPKIIGVCPVPPMFPGEAS